MTDAQKRLYDFYHITPGAPIVKREMGFFTLDRWIEEGYLRPYSEVEDYDAYLQKLFCYDDLACVYLRNLGWCEAEFEPLFENKVLEDRGDYELVQDTAD